MKSYTLPPILNRVLLIQLGDLGDVVLTTPTLRAIKSAHPECALSILVRKPFGDLLRPDPYLDNIFQVEKFRGTLFQRLGKQYELIREIREACFSLTIDLRTGDRGALLSYLSKAPLRIGRASSERKFWHRGAFNLTVPEPPAGPKHAHPGADQSLRLLRVFGIDVENSTPKLQPDPASHHFVSQTLQRMGINPVDGFISINPCSRWKYKEWNPSRWKPIIEWIWQHYNLPTVLVGTVDEQAICTSISEASATHCISMAGMTSLSDLVTLLSLSRLHLGVDSAAPHMAAALGTPSITIHGPTNWRLWRIENETQGIITPGKFCVPCNNMGCGDSGFSQCLDELTAEEVLIRIDRFLEKISFFQARHL